MATCFIIGKRISENQTIVKLLEPIQNIILTRQHEVGLPLHLKIPKINVESNIEYVGIGTDGDMGTPSGPDDTAWYDLGPRPGEKGSAVIDGHSGWKNNIPAVFDNLSELNVGDKLYIQNEFGSTTTFVVRKVRTYDKNKDAQNVFDSNDGKAHLNLITCEGVWDPVTKSSSERLVVFTDME